MAAMLKEMVRRHTVLRVEALGRRAACRTMQWVHAALIALKPGTAYGCKAQKERDITATMLTRWSLRLTTLLSELVGSLCVGASGGELPRSGTPDVPTSSGVCSLQDVESGVAQGRYGV